MKLKRVLEKLSDLASREVIPQGIIDEGRIFSLGSGPIDFTVWA
jgi:hypothetical protein